MELKYILEAILFSAQKPLSPKELRDVFASAVEHAEGNETVRGLKKVKEEQLMAALEELAREHEAANRSYRLACVAGSWQFVTQPEYAPWLKALVGHKARPPRLSQPALETLAIIAYRQPLTRTEIEQVRGVAVDGVMQTLLERGPGRATRPRGGRRPAHDLRHDRPFPRVLRLAEPRGFARRRRVAADSRFKSPRTWPP